MIGRTIGKYRIVDAVGRGGMGTVYKAVDETLDRDVAIKVLNAELLDTDGVRRFRAEAITLAKLDHPSIAHVYDLTRDREDVLMVMEFVAGETFEKIITRDGAMPLDRAVALLSDALEALQHAHDAGIVHRDLKPANLMLTPAGRVKVMDFGIARVQGEAHLTNSGFMMGTPAYMAPEQVRGEDVDARTDVYAAGVVIYRMVTGQLPFKADTAVAMIHKQLNDQHTPSRQFRTDLPLWFDEVLDRALAKDPARRFQTADELRIALSGHARPEQLVATMPPMPTPRALPLPPSISRTPAGTGAAAAPAVTGTGATTITLEKRHIAGGAAFVGILVVAIAVGLFFALRERTPPAVSPSPAAANPAAANPPAAAPPVSTPAPPPSSPAAAAERPAETVPATAAAPAATTAARRRTTAAPAPAPAPAAPAATAAPPLTASPVPSLAAPPVSTPARLDTPLSFGDVRLAVAEGDKVKEYDVLLKFQEGRVWAVAARNPQVSVSMPYPTIVSATYAQSKHPRWKQGLGVAVAAGVFSAPIFFMKSTAHWLTLQSKDTYCVLHLDKKNVNLILPALESRTGLTVQRQAGDK